MVERVFSNGRFQFLMEGVEVDETIGAALTVS